MNYTEYKQMQTQGTGVPHIKLNGLEDYLEARRQCERFETNQIANDLTYQDFLQYEANLNEILEQLNYTDKEQGIYESELEKVSHHMGLVGWTWGGREKSPSAQEIQDAIKSHFITCMQACKPMFMCSSGGITVRTDIHLHTVEVCFDLFSMCEDDETRGIQG